MSLGFNVTDFARSIFAVPPFPNASPATIVRAGRSNEAYRPVATELVRAFRSLRVGGAFWKASGDAPHDEPTTPFLGRCDDPHTFLAALVGRPVHVEGIGPLSALHGTPVDTPETEELLSSLVDNLLLENISYYDPFTGEETSPVTLLEIFANWRTVIDENRSIGAAFGFARWKRNTVEPLLWAGGSVPFLPSRESLLEDVPADRAIAVWKARVPPAFLQQLEVGPWKIIEVEDGFIRSTGLGADCVPPLSIVVDDLGVHYDPRHSNRLEEMLEKGNFSDIEIERANRLRKTIVESGISKYGLGIHKEALLRSSSQNHILVVGQVEDDRSVQFGAGDIRSNLALLKLARTSNPDAWITYRPHPDVEAGHRQGRIPTAEALQYADSVEAERSISSLIASADEVHVITSLAGFEALLQGKSVTTYGTPFYAGWGLTRDLVATPARRGKQRTLDELVAAVLLRYPRYLDPITNLPATPEILVTRLLAGTQRQNGALVRLRRFVGWVRRAIARIPSSR